MTFAVCISEENPAVRFIITLLDDLSFLRKLVLVLLILQKLFNESTRHNSHLNFYFHPGDPSGKQKEEATQWKSEKDNEDGSVTSRLHQDFSDDAVMV